MDQWNKNTDVYSNIKRQGKAATQRAANQDNAEENVTIIDANVRSEKQNKLQEMLTHLQMKHNQLMHTLNQKEKLEASEILAQENNQIKGKYAEALSNLVLFLSEAENDKKMLNDMNL